MLELVQEEEEGAINALRQDLPLCLAASLPTVRLELGSSLSKLSLLSGHFSDFAVIPHAVFVDPKGYCRGLNCDAASVYF